MKTYSELCALERTGDIFDSFLWKVSVIVLLCLSAVSLAFEQVLQLLLAVKFSFFMLLFLVKKISAIYEATVSAEHACFLGDYLGRKIVHPGIYGLSDVLIL